MQNTGQVKLIACCCCFEQGLIFELFTLLSSLIDLQSHGSLAQHPRAGGRFQFAPWNCEVQCRLKTPPGFIWLLRAMQSFFETTFPSSLDSATTTWQQLSYQPPWKDLILNFARTVALVGLLFPISNCRGIFNVRNVHTGPPKFFVLLRED